MVNRNLALFFIGVLPLFGCAQLPTSPHVPNVDVSIALAGTPKNGQIPLLVTVTNNRFNEICISELEGARIISDGIKNEFRRNQREEIMLPRWVPDVRKRVGPNEIMTLRKSVNLSDFSAPDDYLHNLEYVTAAYVLGVYRCKYQDGLLVTQVEIGEGIDMPEDEHFLGIVPQVETQVPLNEDMRRTIGRH